MMKPIEGACHPFNLTDVTEGLDAICRASRRGSEDVKEFIADHRLPLHRPAAIR